MVAPELKVRLLKLCAAFRVMFGFAVGLSVTVELDGVKVKLPALEFHAPAIVWPKVEAFQVPAVIVSVPPTVHPPPEVTVPPDLLIVRLLKL